MSNNITIPSQYQFLYDQAKAGKVKAYFARNANNEAKIKFLTEGKPTYVGFPWAEALYPCAEYIAGGYKQLYRIGCNYRYAPTTSTTTSTNN